MGRIRIACGVEIPNLNFSSKTDGNGRAGLPDGWRKGINANADETAGKAAFGWEAPRAGAGSAFKRDHWFGTSGRALSFAVRADGAAGATSRFVDSPKSLTQMGWGSEVNDPQGTTKDYWWFRIRARVLMLGTAPASDGNAYIRLVAYSDAGESVPTVVTTLSLTPATNFRTDWTILESTPVQLTGVAVDHYRLRISLSEPPAGGGSTNWFTLVVSDLAIETLGPVDAAGLAGGIDGTLAEEGVGGTYYLLSKSIRWQGFNVRPISQGKHSRLGSGAARYYDPSHGVFKRRFTVPLQLLTRTDYEKLTRLWLANRGYSPDSGTHYGQPMPLLLTPNQPDWPFSYYVNWTDAEFPLEPFTDTFQGSTEAGQLYQGLCTFEER